MKTLLIAAAAMAGGAALGFFLCWAAHRLTRGNYTPARRMAAAKKEKWAPWTRCWSWRLWC